MVGFLFLAFIVLMLLNMEVFFSMIFASYLGVLVKTVRQVDLGIIPMRVVDGVDIHALVAIPLFVLAGEIMNKGGITRRLIEFCLTLIGHIKGSLSQVAVLVNIIMAGVSGSGVADASATGSILIPAMKEEGYEVAYAGAVIAAAATIGPIIPPSIPMVIYGVMASVSIGKLFMAGLVPGLLLGFGSMFLCWIFAQRRNYPKRERVGLRICWQAFLKTIWGLFMPVIILGGIVLGVVGVTEAASLAVVYALFVGLFIYREIRVRDLIEVFYQAGITSGVVLILLAAAGIFSWLLAESKINFALTQFLLGISKNPIIILLLINLLLLVIGCVLEPLPALIIFAPALIPVGSSLGLDPIHFGTIIVLNLMIGMLTPPVGFLLFVSAAIGNIPVPRLVKYVLPFLGMALIVLLLVTLFPPFTTLVPNLLW